MAFLLKWWQIAKSVGREPSKPTEARLQETVQKIARDQAEAGKKAYKGYRRMRTLALRAQAEPAKREIIESKLKEEAKTQVRIVKASRKSLFARLRSFLRGDLNQRIKDAKEGVKPLTPPLAAAAVKKALPTLKKFNPWTATREATILASHPNGLV